MRVLLLLLVAVLPLGAAEIKVAAASDLNYVLREVTRAFESRTGHRVLVSLGSSGNFYAQIQNGAPFDVFMSADENYPAELVKAGLAEKTSLFRYARGALVLWVPAGSKLDPQVLGIKVLLDPTITKVAIANPKHAPYGRAAEAALKKLGMYEQVAPKLVLGENISQTAHFVESGNAQAGLIALSLALGTSMKDKGRYWQVPDDAYPALNQAAVVVKASPEVNTAREFIEFLKTAECRSLFERYGFRGVE